MCYILGTVVKMGIVCVFMLVYFWLVVHRSNRGWDGVVVPCGKEDKGRLL